MAKLHSYYVLCPLIDQKSFLGVTKDEEPNNVLVTLGRNVVNKYRLSDQKQIGGWTSKEHITSEVVYDTESNCFVGVFNNNTIKTWKNDTANIEKLKKHKFSSSILKIIPRDNQTALIVFENGNCISLSYGLDNKKSNGKPILKDSSKIKEVSCYTYNNVDYVCYLTMSENSHEIIVCPLKNEVGSMEWSKQTRVKIEREDVYSVGCLLTCKDHNAVYVLWSDAKMSAYNLITKTWRTVGNVPWVSCTSSVSMAWMGDNHIILFGSNIEQDGAIIVAYNTSLGVASCQYPMKMYSKNAKLYCFEDRIILEASNHIGMLPYVVDTSRSLSSLIGSHEVIQNEKTEVADWGTPVEFNIDVPTDMKDLMAIGLSERNICQQLIQDHLETSNHVKILEIIKQFQDIPESVLVQLLAYSMQILSIKNMDVTEYLNICQAKGNRQKFNLLNHVLGLEFCDALIIPYLRNGLQLRDALFLLTYISYLLDSPEVEFDISYETKLLDWFTLLMDAFYQEYVLCKDDNVTKVLERASGIVNQLIKDVGKINSSLPLINKILWTKNNEQEESLSYTIQLMKL